MGAQHSKAIPAIKLIEIRQTNEHKYKRKIATSIIKLLKV